MLLHKVFLDARVKLGFRGILKNLKRVWRGSIKWWWWPRVDRLWSSLCSAESVGRTMTRGKATSMVSNTSRIWRSFSARLERRFRTFDYILWRRFDCRTKNGVAKNFGAHFAIRTLTREGVCTFGTCGQVVDVYFNFKFNNEVITNVIHLMWHCCLLRCIDVVSSMCCKSWREETQLGGFCFHRSFGPLVLGFWIIVPGCQVVEQFGKCAGLRSSASVRELWRCDVEDFRVVIKLLLLLPSSFILCI